LLCFTRGLINNLKTCSGFKTFIRKFNVYKNNCINENRDCFQANLDHAKTVITILKPKKFFSGLENVKKFLKSLQYGVG